MAERFGLQVIFTGMRNDVYDIMSSIDLLVLSSLNEGLGRVLLEAMVAADQSLLQEWRCPGGGRRWYDGHSCTSV